MTTKTETFNFTENPLVTRWTQVLASHAFQSTATGAKTVGAADSVQAAIMWKTSDYAFADNQRATITFGNLNSDFMGVIVRADTTGGGQFYMAYYDQINSRVRIEYWTAGAISGTYLESITATTFAANDTLGLDATGTTLRAYKNGSAIGTGVTHSSLTTGQPGMSYDPDNSAASLISVFEGVDAATSNSIFYYKA